jgi:hypothetical protein
MNKVGLMGLAVLLAIITLAVSRPYISGNETYGFLAIVIIFAICLAMGEIKR